jgi:hypothetical protein
MLSYREIKVVLDAMTDKQLDQPAQAMISQIDDGKTVPLHSIINLKTVKELVSGVETGEEYQKTRGSMDNEHHPNDFVFLVMENTFAEDGTIAFDLETGERFYGKNNKKNVEVEDEFGNTFPANEAGV